MGGLLVVGPASRAGPIAPKAPRPVAELVRVLDATRPEVSPLRLREAVGAIWLAAPTDSVIQLKLPCVHQTPEHLFQSLAQGIAALEVFQTRFRFLGVRQ